MISDKKLATKKDIRTNLLIKLLKLLNQPGRLFFTKGNSEVIHTFDSFSNEYLLLINEQIRNKVCSFPNSLRSYPLLQILLSPAIALVMIWMIFRLFVANQIVTSLINSRRLMEIIEHETIQKNHRS